MQTKVLYHKTMYAIKHKLWYWWHCKMRWFFDKGYLCRPLRWLARKVYHREYGKRLLLSIKISNYADECGRGSSWDDRPFYHMCCNGNAGGWRTRLCDMLEDYQTGYRYHENQLYKLGVYEDV